jgi:C4-dicarboxylate transporter/malic acid transport protein
MKFTEIAKNFNPAWFAAIMGTAVIPLVLSFLDFPFRDVLAAFFFWVAALIFLLILAPWTVKFFLYRENIGKDLSHPVAAHFFPTMPIAMVILAMDFLKFPDLLLSPAWSQALAFWLWLLGSLGIYLFGYLILIRVFSHKGITPAHANFGWFIPPVSQLIIPAAGLELAELYPRSMELIFGLSMISFGVGFFLFLFIGAVVYHRYIYHELPMSRLAPTIFIGMAPTAIIAVILFKMMHLFERQDVLGIAPQVFMPLAKIAILVNWGFSAWWFVMACIVIIHYLRHIELPYALVWWAFTFPTGALCLASAVAWKVTQFSTIFYFFNLATIFLLIVWLIVLLGTAKGVASGKIFLPAP